MPMESSSPNPNPNHGAEREERMRRPGTKRMSRPGTKRFGLTLSVFLSFILGIPFLLKSNIPFLLKSTEIYRSPLPLDSISSLSNRPLPTFPCRFHAVFLKTRPDPHRLSASISRELQSRTSGDRSCGGCGRNHSVLVTVDSGGCVSSGDADGLWRCGAADVSSVLGGGIDDEVVDELLENVIGNAGGFGKVYTVVVVMDKEDHEEVRVVVGKNRHAWILGKIAETDAINMISEIFVKFFMKGGREEGESLQGECDFMPVGLDGSIILSFSLLNADPNDGIYDWELQKADKLFLAPIVEALAPIANISVEIQVLYHTPKASISYWDDNLGSYVFSTKDLPFFVNSNEWHLDTSTAAAGRAKVLQFVVYVPSLNECPLLFRRPNGQTSKTNGFISPMLGGVVVWNPSRCSGNCQPTQVPRKTISPEDMQKIFQVTVRQLRLLFGFKSDYFHGLEGGGRLNILTSKRGFTEWELDVLFRRHVCSNLLSCATTLESLSKLVQSLPRMIVTDEIGKQVKFSLEAASSAQNNAFLGVYDASAVSSWKARVLAEDAFFHPSIMSISYSPIELYSAIHMLLFAPMALIVLLAVDKKLKRYIGGREQNIYHLLLAKTRDILRFRILRPLFRWHPY